MRTAGRRAAPGGARHPRRLGLRARRARATPSRSPTPRCGTRCGRAYPHVLLEASGEAVGLPPGVMGNSEVGHLTLGSGRVIYQDLSRINRAIADGSFFDNPVLDRRHATARSDAGRSLHLMGLLSDAGVHSALGHLQGARAAGAAGTGSDRRLHPRVHRRPRHVAHRRASSYVEELEAFLARRGPGHDRHRLRPLLRHGPRQALGAGEAGLRRAGARRGPGGAGRGRPPSRESYDRGETDEFILPTVVVRRPGFAHQGRRRRGLLQLPARPGPGDVAPRSRRPTSPGSTGARLRRCVDLVGMTEYDPKPGAGGGLPQGGAAARAGGGDQRGRADAAPHRRDREVRARDLLLQRGAGSAVPRGEAVPGAVAQGREHLRPEAADERLRGGRLPRADHGRGPGRLRGAQLRQPRHGGPHRATSRRPSRRSSTSTAAWAGCSRSWRASGPRSWSPPTTATPR